MEKSGKAGSNPKIELILPKSTLLPAIPEKSIKCY